MSEQVATAIVLIVCNFAMFGLGFFLGRLKRSELEHKDNKQNDDDTDRSE